LRKTSSERESSVWPERASPSKPAS
jgi:hypothetical protein